MTFIDALKTGKPMRRKRDHDLTGGGWRWLGSDPIASWTGDVPLWRWLETGCKAPLHRFDYLADDWEVMS